jgi:hypothetical protein
MLPSGNDAAH